MKAIVIIILALSLVMAIYWVMVTAVCWALDRLTNHKQPRRDQLK